MLHMPAAAADPQASDVDAAARTLAFVEALAHRPTISIGVVYAPGSRDGKRAAARAAEMLERAPGPNSATMRAVAVSSDELTGQRFDILYLVPGSGGAAVVDYIRHQRVLSISNDPACLGAKCCVLYVDTSAGVNIVLDTALADATGTKFASVFTMMVKRK